MISIALLYFILGVVFVSIMPIIDGVVGLILTMIETAKGYFSVKISNYNKALRDDQEIPYQQTQVIGFGNYQPEEEEEYYEDE